MEIRRDVFQAIADPTRREIIDLVAHRSLNLNSIAENFDVSRQAISLHIKILTECGLLVIKQQGRERYCEAKFRKLHEVSDWIEKYRILWDKRLDRMEGLLDELQSKNTKRSKKSPGLNKTNNMEKQITVTRIFNAPVELVWKTWTDPELVKRWWGPDMFTCPSAKIDFRVGGQSIVCMKGPEAFDGGKNHYSIWSYKEIIPMKKIEFIQNLADEAGNKMNPVALGMPPDFPVDIRTLVTFKELEKGKTEMTVTEFADMGQMAKFAQMGLEQSIAKMDAIFIS